MYAKSIPSTDVPDIIPMTLYFFSLFIYSLLFLKIAGVSFPGVLKKRDDLGGTEHRHTVVNFPHYKK